ncbi:MAG: rod shape-determining protein RodA, partial [Chitinophagaceae bacterium]
MSKHYRQNTLVTQGVDWIVIWLYASLVLVGITSIFMVEYRPGIDWIAAILEGKASFSKQIIFSIVCVVLATFIILADSKLFTALANLLYAFGILLMLATFALGKNINGSKSWIPLGGGFNLQPAEICKIFTALALAKFLSRQETDFSKLRSQIIAGVLALAPAVLSVAQNETGLAIVYFSFFIVMYREGLPPALLIIGFSFGVLVVATLLIEPNILAVALTVIAALTIYALKRQIKRQKAILYTILFIWVLCVGVQRFAVPYIFNNVFQCYQ